MTTCASTAESNNVKKASEKIPRASLCAKKVEDRVHNKCWEFEEKIFRGILIEASAKDGVNIHEPNSSKHSNPASDSTNDALSSATLSSVVRNYWSQLYPSMSSAKKSIRKGVFFVKQRQKQQESRNALAGNDCGTNINENNQAESFGPTKKGKCDTMIVLGDIILRKLPNNNEQPRYKSHGPKTNDILSRTIGGKLQVAYLDQYLAVVIKPHGMPVQKILVNETTREDENDDEETPAEESAISASTTSTNSANRPVSMHELLLHCLPPPLATEKDPLRRPAAVHRLDRPTYGLLVVARTKPTARFLSHVLQTRNDSLEKRYRAIVHGHLVGESHQTVAKGVGVLIRTPLGGKDCVSEYFVKQKLTLPPGESSNMKAKDSTATKDLNEINHSTTNRLDGNDKEERTMQLTVVDLILHTGRRHQLRKHLASLGHPIVGDTKYGESDMDNSLSIALDSIHINGIETNNQKSSHSNDSIRTRNNASKTAPGLPLMLAALEITFPHPMNAVESSKLGNQNNLATETNITRVEEALDSKYCVFSVDSRHSFDDSARTLTVTTRMPEPMMTILQKCGHEDMW